MALAGGRFALWWLGGFSLGGAIVASLTFAVWLGGGTTLALLAIAVLGAIVGPLLGVSVAWVIVLVAEGLGWSENPRFPRLGCLVRSLNDLLDKAGA